MMIRKIITGCAIVVFSGTAAAQGSFDFDDIPGVNQAPAVSVDLNAVVLGFFREMARQADPATADMLEGLRSIRLRVYHDENNTRQFNNFIDNVTEELEESGWQSVVAAQDAGSKVRIHMQMTEQEVSGMTVMLTDGAEAVFINIDGTVSAEDLGRLMALPPVRDALGSLTGLPGPTRASTPDDETD